LFRGQPVLVLFAQERQRRRRHRIRRKQEQALRLLVFSTGRGSGGEADPSLAAACASPEENNGTRKHSADLTTRPWRSVQRSTENFRPAYGKSFLDDLQGFWWS
jgi:hypothetical protein